MSSRRWIRWPLMLLACAAALYAFVGQRRESQEASEGQELLTAGTQPAPRDAPVPSPARAGGKGSVVLLMVDAEGRGIQDSTQEVYLF